MKSGSTDTEQMLNNTYSNTTRDKGLEIDIQGSKWNGSIENGQTVAV